MNTYDKVTDPDLLASLSFDNGYKEPDEYEIVTDRNLLSSLEDRFSLEIDSVRNQELRDLVDPQPEDRLVQLLCMRAGLQGKEQKL